jgi:hypothetical protein
MQSLSRRILKRPKAFVRRWFDKAATPLRSELHILVARLTRELQNLQANERGIQSRVAGLEQELEHLTRALAAQTDTSNGRHTAVSQALRENTAVTQRLSATVDAHARNLTVRAMNDWIHHVSPATSPLISVIMATRDRAGLLGRAIDSMRAQSYANWELVVVDDCSVDATAETLAAVNDPRVRAVRGNGRGCCAARNIALRHARGTIIAYLDDDNVMHPDWLRAVVWGFEQRPACDVIYGAFVVDNTARIVPNGGGIDLPHLYWHAYDHQAVLNGNVADIGAIAHRAGLPEASFDESLVEMGDWDLLLRLTRDKPPFVLPAIALFYTTDAPHRLSGGPSFAADFENVRAKNRRSA